MISSACRSTWICVSALALWGAPTALAQDGGLRIRPADRDQYSSEPRQIVAATFTVFNDSGSDREIESHVVVPARWNAVVPPGLFLLAARESSLKLVSFTIPEDAVPGDYTVSYEVRDRLHPGYSATSSVRVRVSSTARVQVTLLDTPDIAMAGETFAGVAVFRNAGNAPVNVDYTVRTRAAESVSPRQGRLFLKPSETRRIDLTIVAARVRERAVGRIDVEAAVTDTAVKSNGRGTFQVVPKASALDALRLLDSRLETRYVVRDSPTERSAGWQPAVSGGGYIDEERNNLVRYRFRGPDRRQSGTYGAPQEYWLKLDTPRFSASAGDLNYGLSPLTEPGRLGRGAQFGVRRERWDFTGYGMRDDYGSGNAQHYGAGSSWRTTAHSVLGLNYLSRSAPGDGAGIWSLRGQAEPDEGFTLDVEAGHNDGRAAESGSAVRFSLRDERYATRYYALGWRAEQGFEGPLRDKLYLSTGFDRPDEQGWGWRGYVRLQDWNLTPLDEIDPDDPRRSDSERMRAAALQRQFSLGTTHALGSLAKATFDAVARERATRESYSWRASVNRSWDRLSLTYTFERGDGRDRRSDLRFSTSSQLLSGSLRVGRFQSYGFYWMRDSNSELDDRDPRRESQGFTANYKMGGLGFKLDAQRNVSRFGRSAIYDLSVNHHSESGARLTLAARRIEGRFARDDYMLSYSVPFTMPVGRKRGFSRLRGRVEDAETAAGLANVVLHMNGMAVATNRRGEFEFPAVKAGAHRIVLDHAGLEMRQVPVSMAPLDVTVDGPKDPPLSISLVRSVSIEVRVTLLAQGASAPSTARGVLVSFRHGDTQIRRLTDDAGRARLGGVPPGRWVVSVAEETMPAGFQPAVADVVLELRPGASVDAAIELRPQRREMRMQLPLAVR